ncbi:Tyrosyl-tRNA synthetase cytoplasmic [Fasciola hepatica]|uniref:Tyrosine--tRNA ligase, cytoplasmic n=1 Tax=Fasciola hepatica TaxID=6192 RepID=A0A4E0RY21_FASHE|nr:Tyrosyl-tRNA synthetase cytoplasmic [Fasciola hepatica]
MALTSVHDARKAGAEVVKQVASPLVSGLLYPLLQALDEVHLGVDAQFGGVDQRKIFMLAEKYLPHLGHKKRVHLMNAMVPGLTGAKMSSSEADSKIDLLDSRDLVQRKLARALCPPNTTAEQGNGLLAFLKYVALPLALNEKPGFLVGDADRQYTSYEMLEKDYLSGHLPAETVKKLVMDCLNMRMDVVRKAFESPELATLIQQAYPNEDMNELETAANASASVIARFTWLLPSRLVRTVGRLFASFMWFSAPPAKAITIGPDQTGHETKISPVASQLRDICNNMKPIKDKLSVAQSFEEEFPGCLNAVTNRLRETNRIRCLWTITPDGLPHLGHSIPLRKLARLSQLDGVHVVILVRDVTAHVRGSIPWDLVTSRGRFCRTVLTALFAALQGRMTQFTCVLGSEFQCSPDYMLDFYRIVSLVPEADCYQATDYAPDTLTDPEDGAADSTEVGTARFSLGKLLMPCADLVDTVYLGADLRVSGPTRCAKRRIFDDRFIKHFRESHSCIHVTHPMLSSLQTETASTDGTVIARPMESCLPSSRCSVPSVAAPAEDACLPLVEPPAPGLAATPLTGLKRRLKRAFCQPGNATVNPVLELYRYVILPDLKPGAPLVIHRSDKNGGPLLIDPPEVCTDPSARWRSLEAAFAQEMLHPGDLKPAVEEALSSQQADSLQARLIHALPSWDKLMIQLDAAFPKPQKNSTKVTKPKTKNAPGAMNGVTSGEQTASVKVSSASNAGDTNKTDKDELDPNRLEIRVGRIVSAKKHPDADSLYVEQVDFGSQFGERTVVSGLAGLFPVEKLEGMYGVFVTNLKPVRMRGIESQAMLLCATHVLLDSSEDPKSNRLVRPVCISVTQLEIFGLGSRLVFHSPDISITPRDPDVVIGSKTKFWDRICPDLALGAPDRCVVWRDWRLGTNSSNPSWVFGSEELPVGSTVR